jgi:F0F1-type ATP synthase assembly protein I
MADDDGGNSGRYLIQGFEVAIGVYFGYLAGNWFDRHHNSSPWGLFVGVIVGCAAGMYSLIRAATGPYNKK